jgi:hypothetical protein
MREICPKNTLWDIKPNHVSGIVDISSSYEVYSIKNIIFKTPYPVLLRLLLCREEKIRLKKDTATIEENCPFINQFNSNINNEPIEYACSEKYKKYKMAHIYFRHETPEEGEGSCIFAFISNRSEDPAKIADLLIKTAEWLEVLEEKLYFHLKYINPGNSLHKNDKKRKIYKILEATNIIFKSKKIIKQGTCKFVEDNNGDNLMIEFVKEKITEIGRFTVETA